MIQKIREAECNAVFDEYAAMKGDLVTRHRAPATRAGPPSSRLGKTEAILPRGEQIPGETHHVGERVKAVILDVTQGRAIASRSSCRGPIPTSSAGCSRTRSPRSRTAPSRSRPMAREAGYRTKIAVSSIDMKVDCVGACVGVRGSRIKNIVDELGGERIDIVRWNDSLQVHDPQRPAAGRRSRRCSSIRGWAGPSCW